MEHLFCIQANLLPLNFQFHVSLCVRYLLVMANTPVAGVVDQQRPRSVTPSHTLEKTAEGLQIRTQYRPAEPERKTPNSLDSLCIDAASQGHRTCTHWAAAEVIDWHLSLVTVDKGRRRDRRYRRQEFIAMVTVMTKIRMLIQD